MAKTMSMEQPRRPSRLMTVEGAAAYLRVKPNAVYQLASMGILAKVKLGGKVLFRKGER